MNRQVWRAPSLRHRRWLFAAALLLALLFALRPLGAEAPLFDQVDKFKHLACFAGLTLLAIWAGLRPVWAVAGGLLAFGALIELAQSLAPTRAADPLDLLADLAGIALGLLVLAAWRVVRFSRRPASQTPPAGASQTAAASDASRPR